MIQSGAMLTSSMGKRDALRDLIWNVPAGLWAFLSAGSVVLAYVLLPPQWSWSRPWAILVVVVAGVMITARRLLQRRDEEIARLRQEVVELKKRPYDRALEDEVRRMIKELPGGAPEILRFVLERCPLRSHVIYGWAKPRGEAFEKAVSDTLIVGERQGLLVRLETGHPAVRRTSWDIKEQFKPVLKDILYEHGQDS